MSKFISRPASDEKRSVETYSGAYASDGQKMWRRVLVLVLLAMVFDSADSTIYSLTLPLIREEFGLSLPIMGFIASLFLAGTFVGALLLPMVAEKRGRRVGMVICISVFSLSTGMMGLASSVVLVAVSRFFTGFGYGAQWPIGAAYLSEVVPARRRGLAMAMMQAGYPVGYFLAGVIFAGVTLLGLGWRLCYVLLAVPVLLCFPIMIVLRESEQWRANRLKFKKRTDADSCGVSLRDRYRALFQPSYRRNTLIATGLHVFGSIYSYGLVVWVPTAVTLDFKIDRSSVAEFVMVGLGVGVLGYIVAGPLSDRFGRRLILSLYTLLGMGSVLYLNWLHGQPGITLHQLLIPGCLIGCSLAVSAVYIAYTSEIYPSHLRTLGLGLSVAAGKLMAMFVPTGMGLIAQSTSVSFALLFSTSLGLLMIPIAFCGPETAGCELDEIVS
jgi:MFS family permease